MRTAPDVEGQTLTPRAERARQVQRRRRSISETHVLMRHEAAEERMQKANRLTYLQGGSSHFQ